jgi:3-methylfumaryl-CoA hydratase
MRLLEPIVTNPYANWIGREAQVSSALDAWPARALRATLGLEPQADEVASTLPPLWSWLYFLDATARDSLGLDGHAAKGGFIPPIDLPRRMFAGGRLQFLRPLRLGAPAQQTRRILKVEQKAGSAGPLVFVTIGLDHVQDGALCVQEQRDIVYLNPGPANADAQPEPVPAAMWSLDVEPDAVLLMRFSALTFNGHRIHYDLPYARDVEGYPERVVHGPLIATLLAELVRLQGGASLTAFAFRARSPLFLGDTLRLRGDPDGQGGVALKAVSSSGRLIMTAEARLA